LAALAGLYGAVRLGTRFIGGHRPPLQLLWKGLEEKFESAVIVPRQRRHYAFLTNFSPISLVENVPDTREHSSSSLPKLKFRCQIPNVVSGNEAFERIAIVAKFIVAA